MSVVETTSRIGLRKFMPTAKLPNRDILSRIASSDRSLLERVLEENAECVFTDVFDHADVEKIVMAPHRDPREQAAGNDDSGLDLLRTPTGKSLELDQERHLFLRLNYARHRVCQILERFNNKRLNGEAARDLIKWQRIVMDTRNEIVRVNLPLVLAMVKRTKIANVDYSDLVSEGNLALMRSVDKFDCSRGYRFSTYACRSILKSFARVATRTARYRGYFPTEFDPTLEKSDHVEKQRSNVEDNCMDEIRDALYSASDTLTEVEQEVIKARFAIAARKEDEAQAKTLEQVGEMVGLTKERVRQIQNKALGKLRHILENGTLAV